MIVVKIDLSKIDRTRIFEGKNGAKYYDLLLKETPNDQYGNDYVAQDSLKKEEREAGVKAKILGNAKTLGKKNNQGGHGRGNTSSDFVY